MIYRQRFANQVKLNTFDFTSDIIDRLLQIVTNHVGAALTISTSFMRAIIQHNGLDNFIQNEDPHMVSATLEVLRRCANTENMRHMIPINFESGWALIMRSIRAQKVLIYYIDQNSFKTAPQRFQKIQIITKFGSSTTQSEMASTLLQLCFECGLRCTFSHNLGFNVASARFSRIRTQILAFHRFFV